MSIATIAIAAAFILSLLWIDGKLYLTSDFFRLKAKYPLGEARIVRVNRFNPVFRISHHVHEKVPYKKPAPAKKHVTMYSACGFGNTVKSSPTGTTPVLCGRCFRKRVGGSKETKHLKS